MKTNIKGKHLISLSFIICSLSFSVALTSCSPEEFDGADASGLPTMDGVDFQLSVDQETNQMVASYTAPAGTYPVWILDGTSYSTLTEVGYKNDEAGTHTVELKLGNRNGISQGSVKKTYTFNETKIDYSADFRRITGKEWRIANKEAGHMGCGEAGTDGSGWWSAGADDKKAFGVYDDRITFTADTRKGGNYTYNPGADGKTYVNKETKWANGAAEDVDVELGEQTASWSFEELDWTDKEGNVSKQRYIRLSTNTLFPYISSDAQYEDPLFRVEQLTAKKMVLVYDKPDRSIAWRFILTSEEGEKEWAGFDANSEFNMWKGITPAMSFYYNPDPGWGNEQTPLFEDLFKMGDNDYNITVPQQCFAEWQAQVHFHTNLQASAATNYDFSCIFNSDRDIDGVVVKLTNEDDSEAIIDAHDVNLKAGEEYIFWVSDAPGKDLSRVKLVLDFGHATGETNINVSSIVLKDHANNDGTVPPNNNDQPNPDDPQPSTVDWVAVDSPDNLGAGFNTAGIMTFWWADANWSQVDDPQFSFADGVYTIKANDATVQEWQAQCTITGVPLNIEEGQAYDVRVKIVTNQELGRVTLKVNKDPDVTNDPNTLCYKGDFKLEDGENYLEMIGVVAKNGNDLISFDQGKFILDFGGCPAGFEAKVSDIIIQKHKTEVVMNYDDADNLWKAVDEGTVASQFSYYFAAGNDWHPIDYTEAQHSGNTYELTLPAENGNQQWQAQFHIDTELTASASKAYNFQLVMETDADCPGVTIKLTDAGDTNFFCEGRHDITADEPYVYTLKGATLKEGADATAIRLFFDFGGSPAGTHVKISKIIFKEA